MIEKKTFKIELPCEENLLMIEHEVDVQMEFEEEHLSMEFLIFFEVLNGIWKYYNRNWKWWFI